MKKKNALAKTGGMLVMFCFLWLTGCASNIPAPVFERDGQPAANYPPQTKEGYTVKNGDTLYSIAREHGMDYRELISMNGIENPNQLAVGRVLRIKPASVVAVAPVSSAVVVARPIAPEVVVEKKPLSVNGDTLKREPKGGKEAYSEQALARAQKTDSTKAADASRAADNPAKGEASLHTAGASAGGEERGWLWPANGRAIGNYGEKGNKGLDIAGKSGDPVVAVADGKVILANNTLRGYGNMVVVKHSNNLITVYAHNSRMLVREQQSVSKGQKIAEMGNTDADQVKLHFEVRLDGKPVDPLKYLPPR